MGLETYDCNVASSSLPTHLPHHLFEVKRRAPREEAGEKATDCTILHSFPRELVSFSLGSIWLLLQHNVSLSLTQSLVIVKTRQQSLTRRESEKYGYSIPVGLRLGPFKMYLVSGADHYVTLFNNKASRSMNTKAAVLLALENLFGTPANVIPFYAADDSGVNSTPLPGSRVRPEHRITYFQTRAAHKHLSGPGLVQMTELFLNVLRRRIHASHIESEWVDLPDLYQFLQHEVFSAAVEALCGTHLLSQSPTFVEDFWEFVSSVPTLFKGFPRWMSPKPYRIRDRLLDAIKRWHKLAHERSDCTKIDANDPEWEPYFGSKLMRARQEYSRSMEFMNADALAAEDLGLIFAYDPQSPTR